MNRLIFAAIWIALQLLYLSGWAVYEAVRTLPDAGVSILVRTVPVDPRDLLRGQYMRLNYPFSRPPGTLNAQPNQTVWVVLRPTPDGDQVFYEPVDYSLNRPMNVQPNDVVIRGAGSRSGRLELGIERYFVPEGTETPNAADVTVRLRVGGDDRPRIETVYERGVPWP